MSRYNLLSGTYVASKCEPSYITRLRISIRVTNPTRSAQHSGTRGHAIICLRMKIIVSQRHQWSGDTVEKVVDIDIQIYISDIDETFPSAECDGRWQQVGQQFSVCLWVEHRVYQISHRCLRLIGIWIFQWFDCSEWHTGHVIAAR
jgi:hypothetical protein